MDIRNKSAIFAVVYLRFITNNMTEDISMGNGKNKYRFYLWDYLWCWGRNGNKGGQKGLMVPFCCIVTLWH